MPDRVEGEGVVLVVFVVKVWPGMMEPLGRVERVRVVYVWGREGAIVGGWGCLDGGVVGCLGVEDCALRMGELSAVLGLAKL